MKQIQITDRSGKETQFLLPDDQIEHLTQTAAAHGCTVQVIGKDKTR